MKLRIFSKKATIFGEIQEKINKIFSVKQIRYSLGNSFSVTAGNIIHLGVRCHLTLCLFEI